MEIFNLVLQKLTESYIKVKNALLSMLIKTDLKKILKMQLQRMSRKRRGKINIIPSFESEMQQEPEPRRCLIILMST